MPRTTSTPTPVSPEPEVVVEKPKQELVEIMIDPEVTDGGLRVNGKLYVGRVKVPADQADDLMRMQEEYNETKKKIMDPNVSVRMKNDFQKEALFLADPAQHQNKRGFSRDYGLLSAKEWGYCSPEFKAHLLELRKQLYGY